MPFRKNLFFNAPRVTIVSIFLSILIALIALAGWIFNLEPLYTFNSNWPSIKVNTAIGILFSGISLLLFIWQRRLPALFLSIIVFLLGIVTLGEHLFHFNAHIDEWLVSDKGTLIDKYHGRMAQFTAIASIIMSISLIAYSYKRKWVQKLSEVSAILVLIMSSAGFIGALYNAGQMFRNANIASFSMPTGLTGLLISIGLLFSKPDTGFLAAFNKQTTVAKTGIKGIFIIIIVLIVIGWLCLKGEENGVFNKEMGLVIMIIIFSICFLVLAQIGIQRLNNSEGRLIISEKNLRHVLSSTADVFYVIDRSYRITLINEAAEKILTKVWGKRVSLGVNIFDLMPDEKDEPIRQSFKKVFAGEKVEYELHHSSKDLPEWVLVNYNPVINNDGSVIGAYIVTKDISDQKRVEDELRKNEEKYRTIIEQAPDGIFVADQSGFIVDTNNCGSSMLGYTKEELQKIKFMDLVSQTDLKNNPIKYDELQSGKTALNERRLIKKGGSEILVEISARLLSDGKYHSIIRDITERKKIEAKLIEQEELLRLFVEHSPASLAMFDNDMRYIIASYRWMTDYNLGDQQIIGKSHYEIFPGIPQRWKDIHQRCLAGASEKNNEDSFTRVDGSVDWVQWEIHPWYKASGDVGGIIMFTEVITERKKAEDALKESEERYKVLVENAPEALVVFDVEKKNFISVSESAIELFGMPKEELLKVGPLELSPEYQPDGRLSAEAAIENIKEAVAGNKPVFEWLHCDVHGKLIPCEVWLVRLPSEKHVLIRGSIIDITERKKTQSELEESYKAIRQLTEHIQNVREEERIGIAREIHDELGQQLSVLKMDISWLGKKIDKDDIEVTQKINDLLKITDDTIRSVRKISSELRPSLLDDLGLVATMEWHLKEFEKRSGIKTSFIATEAEDELPGSIKTTLFRVFQESLTNVARHAEATNIKVSLKHKNNTCILNITDNGKGFDKQKIADKRTLGLLGMRERTAMTGGSYDIISTPGKGTTIIVAIPLIDI